MQLRADQLEGHLRAGRGLRPLYTLHGDEALLMQEAADAIRQAARVAGCSEREVFHVAGAYFDWSGVLGAAQERSLFAEQRLIEIRIPGGKPGKDGSEALQRYAERLSEGVITLVLLPRLDNTQLKSGWFCALESAGTTVRIDPVERAALPTWIARRMAAQGQRVREGEEGERTLAFFADRVEGNLLAAHQEIMKLALLYPAGELGADQVEAAVLNVARYDVFKLSEAVLGGHAVRVQRMLDGLKAEGEAEVLVHYTLAEDIRALKRVKDAIGQGRPLPMALREQRIWGVKERLFERVLPKLSDATLSELLQSAHVVDGIVKGLKQPDWPHNGWQALHRLALQLCGLCAAVPAARSSR